MTQLRTTRLDVPGVPPSRNVIDAKSWRVGARVRRDWKDHMLWALRIAKVPKGLRHVHARAELYFPTNRRRDEGNYRYALEKALGDALVADGHLADDTPQYFTFGAVHFSTGPLSTSVTLEWEVP